MAKKKTTRTPLVESPRTKKSADIGTRFSAWLIFTVIMSLLPLLVNAFNLCNKGELKYIEQLIYRGELLLITAVIAADGIGEIIFISSGMFKTLAAGAAVLIIMAASVMFSMISTSIENGKNVDKSLIRNISVPLFLITVILIGISIYIKDKDES